MTVPVAMKVNAFPEVCAELSRTITSFAARVLFVCDELKDAVSQLSDCHIIDAEDKEALFGSLAQISRAVDEAEADLTHLACCLNGYEASLRRLRAIAVGTIDDRYGDSHNPAFPKSNGFPLDSAVPVGEEGLWAMSKNERESFKEGYFKTIKLTEPMIVYRYFGSTVERPTAHKKYWGSDAFSLFYSTKQFFDKESIQKGLALDPRWGNSLAYEAALTLPPGTVISYGLTAPQGYGKTIPGGEQQIILRLFRSGDKDSTRDHAFELLFRDFCDRGLLRIKTLDSY